jgi:hypothetical protein
VSTGRLSQEQYNICNIVRFPNLPARRRKGRIHPESLEFLFGRENASGHRGIGETGNNHIYVNPITGYLQSQ